MKGYEVCYFQENVVLVQLVSVEPLIQYREVREFSEEVVFQLRQE